MYAFTLRRKWRWLRVWGLGGIISLISQKAAAQPDYCQASQRKKDEGVDCRAWVIKMLSQFPSE